MGFLIYLFIGVIILLVAGVKTKDEDGDFVKYINFLLGSLFWPIIIIVGLYHLAIGGEFKWPWLSGEKSNKSDDD